MKTYVWKARIRNPKGLIFEVQVQAPTFAAAKTMIESMHCNGGSTLASGVTKL